MAKTVDVREIAINFLKCYLIKNLIAISNAIMSDGKCGYRSIMPRNH